MDSSSHTDNPDNIYSIVILILNIILVTYTMVNKIYKNYTAKPKVVKDADYYVEKYNNILKEKGIDTVEMYNKKINV